MRLKLIVIGEIITTKNNHFRRPVQKAFFLCSHHLFACFDYICNMKNDNDWKQRLGVVYSTNPDYQYQMAEEVEAETLPAGKQHLIVAIDRRQRAGKQVTLVKGFVGRSEDLAALAKTLKTKCGVGGTAKDGEITIQGDLRDKIVALLASMGYNAKRGN